MILRINPKIGSHGIHPPFTDMTFKRIFGQEANKSLIIEEMTTLEIVADEASMTDEERARYESELKRDTDNRYALKGEREKDLKEGREEGMKEGEYHKSVEIAKKYAKHRSL